MNAYFALNQFTCEMLFAFKINSISQWYSPNRNQYAVALILVDKANQFKLEENLNPSIQFKL